jgi:hypothetical protein
VLLRAHALSGEVRYLDSARRLGDFLLLAQLPAPQPGWAQQYNEAMQPAWARKFEPPALSARESYGAIEALFKLWVATGDEKYRESIPTALTWLEKVRLPDGQWSRFYELGTDRPLYCHADTYKITYDDSDLPTHYGFKIESSLMSKIERMRKDLERPREEIQKSNAAPDSEERWAKAARGLVEKVNKALRSVADDGVWHSSGKIEGQSLCKEPQRDGTLLRSRDESGRSFSEVGPSGVGREDASASLHFLITAPSVCSAFCHSMPLSPLLLLSSLSPSPNTTPSFITRILTPRILSRAASSVFPPSLSM